MTMNFEILDLGVNNLKSLLIGFSEVNKNGRISIIDEANKSESPDLLVLPGVGAFGVAMQRIRDRGFDSLIENHKNSGKKAFGICLGMQLMFESSEESENIPGLGIFAGGVRRLPENEKVPNVGWLEAEFQKRLQWNSNPLDGDFYFVHSYYAEPKEPDQVFARSMHGDFSFTSAILSDHALGVQFHPEKSSNSGLKVLESVIEWAGNA